MKLINFIYKHNSKRNLIITAIILIIGITLINTRYFGLVSLPNEKFIDLYFFYNVDKFYEVLQSLTDIEILGYKLVHIADYFFALGLYPFVALLLSRIVKIDSSFRVVVILPLIAGVFDVLENFAMDIHLYNYPNEFIMFGTLSPLFTIVKFVYVYLSIILIVIIPIIKLVQRRFISNK